jgi:hypothetical protein
MRGKKTNQITFCTCVLETVRRLDDQVIISKLQASLSVLLILASYIE